MAIFYRSKTQDVQDELAQDGEILSGMIGMSAHLVVAEDDIHVPKQAVLGVPVHADGLVHALRVGEQAAQVGTTINRGLPLDRPLARHHRERPQVWPALRRVQAVNLVEDMAPPNFEAAMVLVDDFVKLMRRLAWHRLEGADKMLDRRGQCGLIVLDRQDIVGTAITSGLRNGWLSAHGVEGDVATFQCQGRQQFVNGGLFSFDFAAVARCPRTRPAWPANALTRFSGVAPIFPDRRLILPSIATTSPFVKAGTT